MKQKPMLGSREWLEQTLNRPAARSVKGRSRPTQRFLVMDADGQLDYAEGGNTAVARAILTTMQKAGVVKRFKLEPFQLTLAEHGVKAVPDILFELNDDRVFVGETKSERFLTEKKLAKCSQVEQVVNAAGMKYLLWTSRWPLSPACWRLIRTMRRCGTANISSDQIDQVVALLTDGPLTLGELRKRGVYRDVVLAGVWDGHLHINLFSDISDATLVSLDVSARRFDTILHAPVKALDFWDSLSRNGQVRRAGPAGIPQIVHHQHQHRSSLV